MSFQPKKYHGEVILSHLRDTLDIREILMKFSKINFSLKMEKANILPSTVPIGLFS